MRIALIRYHDKGDINTRLPESLNRVRGTLPPLGIAYIASYLEKKGHEVVIIDAIAENLTADDLRDRLKKFRIEVAGITTMTSTMEGSLEAARIAKECGAKVIVGGPHLSAYPEETLSYDFIDFCIMGDGEVPMAELIEALEGKRDFKDIKGLLYRDSGNIVNNGVYILMELDKYPPPAYHLLPLNKYTSIISFNTMTTMITARGCPYRCGFCFTQPTDRVYRVIDPVRVVDIMEELHNRYRIDEIMFYDDTLTLNRKHVMDLCDEMKKRRLKIRWESPCRVDTVDFELLKRMADSGCFRLRFGVESGNERILKLMNKRIKLGQVEDAFRWCRELGIETFAYFIVGYIEEDASTIKDTIKFAKKIDPDFVMFTVATPYPFTNLFDLAAEKGLISKDYWRDFTLGKRDERLPYLMKDSEYWIKKAYRDFYFRPRFIVKKIFRINSIDSIKKMLDAARGLVFFKTST